MDCREFLHRYSDYDDSLLSPVELEGFRDHLAGCQSCARYDRVLRKGRMLARQIPGPRPSDDFVPRLHSRIQHSRRSRRPAPVPVLGAAAAMAGVTVVLTSLWAVSLMDPAPVAETAVAPAPEARVAANDWAWPVGGGGGVATPANGLASVDRAERSGLKGWASGVDQPAAVAYSPLVTGTPTYRLAGGTSLTTGTSTARTLD